MNARWTTASAPAKASRSASGSRTSPWRYSILLQPCAEGSNGRRATPTIRPTRRSASSSGISPNPNVPVGPVTATVSASLPIEAAQSESLLDQLADLARLHRSRRAAGRGLLAEREPLPVAQRDPGAVGVLSAHDQAGHERRPGIRAGEPVAGLDVDERDRLGNEPVEIEPLPVLGGLKDELGTVLDHPELPARLLIRASRAERDRLEQGAVTEA